MTHSRYVKGPEIIPLALVCLTVGTVLLIYRNTSLSMIEVWTRSGTYAHGFLALPAFAWLVFRARSQLAELRPTTKWTGLFLLIVCVAVWAVATVSRVNVISQLTVISMIPVVLFTIMGPQGLSLLSFPLACLAFAVPAGDFLTEPMMSVTATGAVALLRRSGIAVYQQGWVFSTAVADFQVADVCSGVRYLIAATFTSLLLAYVMIRSWRRRVLFIITGFMLSVLANVVRVYLTVLLAHWFGIRTAAGIDHLLYGWLWFGLLVAILVGLASAMSDVPAPPGTPSPQLTDMFSGTIRAMPLRYLASIAACVSVLAAGPPLVAYGKQRLAEQTDGVAIAVPGQIGAAFAYRDHWLPPWIRPEATEYERHVEYRDRSGSFYLHILMPSHDDSGDDLSSLRARLRGRGFVVLSDDRVSAETSGLDMDIRELALDGRDGRVLIAYWFVVGDHATDNAAVATLLHGARVLSGRSGRSALVAFALDTRGIKRPRDRLHAVAAAGNKRIRDCLNQPALSDCRPPPSPVTW